MNFKILSVKRVDDTLFTEVEYAFPDGPVVVSIPHFQPQSKADVLLGIKNRAASEAAKLNAGKTCDTLIGQLSIGAVTAV